MRGVDLNIGRAEADKLGNFLAQNRDNVIQEIIERRIGISGILRRPEVRPQGGTRKRYLRNSIRLVLQVRKFIRRERTKTLELRFDQPIFAWAADVFSVDGKGFGQGNTPESNDHTTLHVLGHSFDFTQIFTYAGSGYNSFFGIVSDTPFSSLSFTAAGDGDRWRLDNVSIARR